jgi:hypothetical protein
VSYKINVWHPFSATLIRFAVELIGICPLALFTTKLFFFFSWGLTTDNCPSECKGVAIRIRYVRENVIRFTHLCCLRMYSNFGSDKLSKGMNIEPRPSIPRTRMICMNYVC